MYICHMKTEFEKMQSGELYNIEDPEIQQSLAHAKIVLQKLNQLTLFSPEYRATLNDLIPSAPASACICPPFYCDHGSCITLGENCFINYNCTFLDGGHIVLGNHVLIGPGCQIVTPQHPKKFMERRLPQESCHAITIGDDTWLGAGVIVCPGVTIGSRCIIGAGSVVIRDIPDDTMAAGNPAVVKKRLL